MISDAGSVGKTSSPKSSEDGPGDWSVSVVLPVHEGVAPIHLERCLQSLKAQTLPPDEVVVVEDGSLTEPHYGILDRAVELLPNVRRIRLAKNSGAGVANQAGLNAAHGAWIAKVDADDICMPHRLERSLEALRTGAFDVVSTAVSEFAEDETQLLGIRRNPETHTAIVKRMRINNPLNHPASVYRRQLALSVGGYSNLRFMQDYDLFARMLAAGARMHNLPEPLVKFRADAGMLRRRKSWRMLRCEVQLQRNLVTYGIVGWPRAVLNLILRSVARVAPAWALRFAYRTVFYGRGTKP